MNKTHYKVLILGAGTGGVAVAARLAAKLDSHEIAVVEPASVHCYQPLWTLVGAGIVKKEKTARPMSKVIPSGVTWIQDQIESINPNSKFVTCTSGKFISFDFLVIATGLKLDWRKINGLEGQLGQNGICSIYDYGEAEKTFAMINSFKGGQAIFTMPPVPIKCAGAPQKIMYLADEIFRKNNVREKTSLIYTTAGKVIFGVPTFAKALLEVVKRKNISIQYSHKLIEVNANSKTAIFEKSSEAQVDGKSVVEIEHVSLKYDLLHVVPPMSAHDFITEAGLAFTEGAQKGWLKVDPTTLQHIQFNFIFGIGDVTGVPNSKTGAAIRKQAPVVTNNLLALMVGKKPASYYDGYSSCPLVTGEGKVILAEFGYDGKLMPSFPMDMAKERWSMWFLKRHLLPHIYWRGMMKGRM